MKTLDMFFDAKEIATFMACFHLNKSDFSDYLPKDNTTTYAKQNKP